MPVLSIMAANDSPSGHSSGVPSRSIPSNRPGPRKCAGIPGGSADPATGERKRFSSEILPPWCRKTPKITEVLPLLYLHGLSSGDFVPAAQDRWCAVNAPHLVALVRAGATFINGKLAERPEETAA
jgi:hypothetical protein